MNQSADRRRKPESKIEFTLMAAVSLDGRITRGNKEGSVWTSKEDKAWFQKELNRYDAVIMGRKTFESVSRPLTPRNRIVFTTNTTSLQTGVYKDVVAFRGSAHKLESLLQERKWSRVAVLGGTHIYDWFLKRNLVSEMYLTVEPVIFGSGKAISSQGHPLFREFTLVSIRKLNSKGTLLLHYKSSN